MNALKSSSGLSAFETAHLLWIFAAFALSAWLSLIYKKTDMSGRARLRLGVSAAAVGMQLLRAALLAVRAEYGLSQLPLHLCSITVYLCLWYSLRPSELMGQFLFAFSLPGSVLGLAFPGWSFRPVGDMVSILSFLLHIVPAAFVLMQVYAGELCPKIKMLPRVCALMCVVAMPIYILDIKTGQNFMFLNFPPEGTPLELFAFLGRPAYLLGMIPIAAFIWLGMYWPFMVRKR